MKAEYAGAGLRKGFLASWAIVVLYLLVCSAESFCLTINAGDSSAKSIGPLRIEQYGVYHAVEEISQKAHVPIGIDAILPAKERTIKLEFAGGTVADLLNLLVSQAPGYEWNEAQDGMIHIYRKNAQVSLLNIEVDYPGAEKKTRQQIWEELSTLPEIPQWLRSNHCLRQEFFMGNEFKWHNNPISIPAGPISVRQLFDDVAIVSGSNSWSVLESTPPDAPCHISLMLW